MPTPPFLAPIPSASITYSPPAARTVTLLLGGLAVGLLGLLAGGLWAVAGAVVAVSAVGVAYALELRRLWGMQDPPAHALDRRYGMGPASAG